MDFFRNENFFLYLPLILWIGGIFYLSSNKGSVAKTSKYVEPILNSLIPDTSEEKLRIYHLCFRKLCHFVGYAILALFASIVFYNSSISVVNKFWYLPAFFVVLIVASADEFKQSFYANRTGSISDVGLDCAGGLTNIFLFWLTYD